MSVPLLHWPTVKRWFDRLRIRLGKSLRWVLLGVCLVGLAIGLILHDRLVPRASDIEYTFGTGVRILRTKYPLRTESGETTIDLRLTVQASSWAARHVVIHADNCLRALMINNRFYRVPSNACDYDVGVAIDWGDFLQSGENVILAQVYNEGGGATFSFEPSLQDWRTLVTYALLICSIIGALTLILFGWKRSWLSPPSVTVIFAACVVRLAYLFHTTPWQYAHDVDGHIEYIKYIALNGRLPEPFMGWESWQPPLYYLLAGGHWAVGQWLGLSERSLLLQTQLVAWLLALLGLLACAWWLHAVAGSERRPVLAAGVLAAAATAPAVVFNATRINNDVLAVAFSIGTMVMLQHWWMHPRRRTLVLATLCAIAAVAAKGSGLVLLPAFGIIVLLGGKGRWFLRFFRAAVPCLCAFAVFLAIGLWRGTIHGEHESLNHTVVGNVGSLNSELRLGREPWHFAVFNPVAVVTHPLADPWNGARRQFYWEYAYRTWLFGEFDYDRSLMRLGQWIALLGLGLVAGAAAGLIRLRMRAYWPAGLFVVSLVAGHIVFTVVSPFSTSQDFRYILPVLLPLSVFLLGGLQSMPKRYDGAAVGVLLSFAALASAFVLSL